MKHDITFPVAACIMAALLLFSLVSSGAAVISSPHPFSSSEDISPASSEVNEYKYGYIDPDIYIDQSNYSYGAAGFSGGYDRAVRTVLPEKYDLRDEGRAPSMRDQGSYGVCWAFASLASVESNLLTDNKDTYEDIDLSERHLAYFANHREDINDITNPLPGLEGLRGDYGYTKPQEEYMNNGGHALMSTFTLMSWIGAVDEYSALYLNMGYDLPPLDGDLALYADEVHVQNVSWVSVTDRNAIKSMLMESGAASISIYMNQKNPANVKAISANTSAYYCRDNPTSSNHAVTLIGWDDNFAKENFATEPDGDGAWLIQNSWGEDTQYSYLWVSYYDPLMNKDGGFVSFFDADDADVYDHNYQYDGESINYGKWSSQSGSAVTLANVYTAGSDELLKAVSFATAQTDVGYSIQVYKNPVSGNPSSGTALLSSPQTGFVQYAGYHTIPLSEPAELSEGDAFTVVIRLSVDSGVIYILSEASENSADPAFRGYAENGQSYVNPGNVWSDFHTDLPDAGNLRIKAYTTDLNPTPVFAGGSGTAGDPYLIATEEQLDYVRYGLGKHYRLINDIDLSGYAAGEGWRPIGTCDVNVFHGSFDGDGHTISNLFINRPYTACVGLFGWVTEASFTDVVLTEANVTGDYGVGGLVGYAVVDVSIQNCSSDAVISAESSAGGLVGTLYENNIVEECYSSSAVSVSGNVSGGLAGWMYQNNSIVTSSADSSVSVGYGGAGGLVGLVQKENTITSCSAAADVSGGWSLGGFVGEVTESNAISGCYATANVSGYDASIGGFVGYQGAENTISDSYSCANVSGDWWTGGFAGRVDGGSISNCYSAGAVNATVDVGGFAGHVRGGEVRDCFALTESASGLSLTDRVAGNVTFGTVSDCFAWKDMQNVYGAFNGFVSGTNVSSADVWGNETLFAGAGFDFSDAGVWQMGVANDQYKLPELNCAPVLFPDMRNASYLSVAEGEISVVDNTTLTWNAEIPARIGYSLPPAKLSELTAPVFLWNTSSLILTENVSAWKVVGSVEISVAASLTEDNHVVISDTAGASELLVTFTGRRLGDVNGDGHIRGSDAVMIARDVVKMIQLTDMERFYADVTGEGSVGGTDAVAIAKYAVGLVGPDYVGV